MKRFVLPILLLLTMSAVTAQAATNVWVDTFTLNITKIALPGVSPSNVTINAVEGGTATATMTLTNAGNVVVGFSLTGSAISTNSPYATYEETVLVENSVSFKPAQFESTTVFAETNWNGSSTTTLDLGFSTTIYGVTYSDFIVKANGNMQLINGTSVLNITTGYDGDDFDQTWIRYKKETDRLIIAWGVDPNSTGFDAGMFQVWVYENGDVSFLYSRGTGSSTAWYKVDMTPIEWISASPTTGTLTGGGSAVVTFTFNGEGQPAGTENFSATVLWSNGETTTVPVTVQIEAEAQQLDLPTDPTFYGPAGLITHTNITVTNSGNTALSYVITYPVATYTADQVDYANNWISGGTAVPEANLGSTSYELGFPFTFFGSVYTNLTVHEDGTLSLGNASILAFSDNIEVDYGAEITFRRNAAATWAVVSWNNLSQNGDNENYTFQAILNRDGTIRCNYFNLGSDWTNSTIRITDGTTAVGGSLNNETTVILTTNEEVYVSGTTNITIGNSTWTKDVYATNVTVSTTYTNQIITQSILFVPDARQVISASPITGTIAGGETAQITLTGDARTLDDGGSSSVSANTTLTFNYSGNSDDLNVTFIATNSADTAYPDLSPAAVASMWGTSYEPNIWTEQDGLGSARTIYWPAAEDSLSRIYQVLYTSSLAEPFETIATVTNSCVFVDEDPVRIDNDQGYYKVTVE